MAAEGPHITVINKKIRGVEKKLQRVRNVEDKKAKDPNFKINADQERLLNAKPYLQKNLEEYQEIRETFTGMKAASTENNDQVRELLRLLHAVNLLNVAGFTPAEDVNASAVVTGANNEVKEEDLKALRHLINQLTGVIRNPDVDFDTRVENSITSWQDFVNGKGTTGKSPSAELKARYQAILDSPLCKPKPKEIPKEEPAEASQEVGEESTTDAAQPEPGQPEVEAAAEESPRERGNGRRGRGRRGGRRGGRREAGDRGEDNGNESTSTSAPAEAASESSPADATASEAPADGEGRPSRGRRGRGGPRRGRKRGGAEGGEPANGRSEDTAAGSASDKPEGAPRERGGRRGRGGRGRGGRGGRQAGEDRAPAAESN